MKQIERARATDIMVEHSLWRAEGPLGIRVCAGKDCVHAYPQGMIPTQLDILTHQLRKLEDAGYGFLPEGGQ